MSRVRGKKLSRTQKTFMGFGALGFIAFGTWVPLMLVFYVVYVGLPIAGTGLAITVGAFAAVVSTTHLAGKASDRFGAFRTLSFGAVGQALAASMTLIPLHGLALPAMVTFIGTVGNGFYFTADTEAIRRISADEKQSDQMFSWMASVRVIGFGLGAGIGGVVLLFEEHRPWLWFLTFGGVSLCMAIASIGMFSLRHIDVSWIPHGFEEAVHDKPPTMREAICNPAFGVFIFGVTAVSIVTLMMDNVLALYVIGANIPIWTIPSCITLACAMSAVTPFAVPRLSEHFGKLTVLVVAAFICAAAYAGFGFTAFVGSVSAVIMLMSASTVYGVADGIAAALTNAVAISFAPKHLSGSHAAWHSAAWQIGSVVAPALSMRMLKWHIAAPWFLGTALACVSGFAYLWTRSKFRQTG